MKKYRKKSRLKAHPHYSGIKFYSFIIGHVDSKADCRIYFDWKIPAVDLRNAVLMYELLHLYKLNKFYGHSKEPIRLGNYYNDLFHQVIEYKKVHDARLGYTVARYKELRRFNRHDIKRILERY